MTGITKYLKAAVSVVVLTAILNGCVPSVEVVEESREVPDAYQNKSMDTLNTAAYIKWRDFFSDPNLVELIDSALVNNQELHIMLQQVEIANNEITARKGEYLPFVDIQAGAELEKVGRYTSQGANDANTEIKPGKEFPEPLPNLELLLSASWELDVWKKLRNAKKAAVFEYLATVEGKNFMITSLVSEIADSYYELLALDNELSLIEQNLVIQRNALEVVKLQKQAARATELAVRRFEAEVAKNQSQRYQIRQRIVETENRINFLTGRTPRDILRSSGDLIGITVDTIYAGIPSQLLINRPDIRQAELELEAAKLNTVVARANFLPSFGIRAGVGFEAFSSRYLFSTPESLLYTAAADMVAPLINRNAIKAEYQNANSRQIQAVYEYEKTILAGYIEVVNELSNIDNLRESFELKEDQVQALTESIDLSTSLFQSARADYLEVLLTQREALESKIELLETKKEQMLARVKLYRALGGGWN